MHDLGPSYREPGFLISQNATSSKYTFPGCVILSTLVPGSGSIQLPDLTGLGCGLRLGFCVVFTIIVSLTLTLTLITTLTVILS